MFLFVYHTPLPGIKIRFTRSSAKRSEKKKEDKIMKKTDSAEEIEVQEWIIACDKKKCTTRKQLHYVTKTSQCNNRHQIVESNEDQTLMQQNNKNLRVLKKERDLYNVQLIDKNVLDVLI